MRADAIFIGIEVQDDAAHDAGLAAKLEETCPVDIYADAGGRVEIVERNVDECILCGMCVDVSPPGAVRVHRLYEAELAA
jgi:NAD-dependent dihydropyrimidine dehydrogenase PreA subunit